VRGAHEALVAAPAERLARRGAAAADALGVRGRAGDGRREREAGLRERARERGRLALAEEAVDLAERRGEEVGRGAERARGGARGGAAARRRARGRGAGAARGARLGRRLVRGAEGGDGVGAAAEVGEALGAAAALGAAGPGVDLRRRRRAGGRRVGGRPRRGEAVGLGRRRLRARLPPPAAP
jgi:hypothetical protein